jgi:hypothetical protein
MRAAKEREDEARGSINYLEAVAYTSVILLVAAAAVGWFDVMMPW